MSSVDIENNKGSLAFPQEQAPAAENGSAPNKNRKKNKKIILAAIASLALIGLVVGLSVGLTRNNNNAQDEAPATTVTSQFTETKAFIDAVCSDEDKSMCEEKCKPVDCCSPFAQDNCLKENAEKCMEYAMCHVVKEVETMGAPSNLSDICASDKEECARECEKVKCCFDATDLCQDTQFLTCMDYAACQVLNTKSTVDPAPADLWETCMDSATQDDCEDECAKASCCWDNDASANCLETDLITCMTYAPCGSLLLEAPNTIVPLPAETFLGDCSIDSVLTGEGYDICEKECEEATCCSATDDSNCFMEDPIGCLQHIQCGLLAFAGGDMKRADTEQLQEDCDLQEILSGGSTEKCEEACEPAKCCVAQGDENCLVDGNVLACASYLPCLPVLILGENGLGDIFTGEGLPDFGDWGDYDNGNFPGFGGGGTDESEEDGQAAFPPLFGEGTIGEPPEDLQEKCSPANIDSGECEEACEEVKCCTSTGDDFCLMENIIMCATWNIQGCFALHNFQQA